MSLVRAMELEGKMERAPFEPLRLLPSQLSPRGALTGDRRLCAAMLEEAAELLSGKGCHATRGDFLDTVRWAAEEQGFTPRSFSFEWLCEIAGIDAGHWRRYLLGAAWSTAPVALGKRRPRVKKLELAEDFTGVEGADI